VEMYWIYWPRCSDVGPAAVGSGIWSMSVAKGGQRGGEETYSYWNGNSATCYDIRTREETAIDFRSTS